MTGPYLRPPQYRNTDIEIQFFETFCERNPNALRAAQTKLFRDENTSRSSKILYFVGNTGSDHAVISG